MTKSLHLQVEEKIDLLNNNQIQKNKNNNLTRTTLSTPSMSRHTYTNSLLIDQFLFFFIYSSSFLYSTYSPSAVGWMDASLSIINCVVDMNGNCLGNSLQLQTFSFFPFSIPHFHPTRFNCCGAFNLPQTVAVQV